MQPNWGKGVTMVEMRLCMASDKADEAGVVRFG
jgi:hypothetical protein